ncbi:ribbon-helix-helix domain-containing protein [Azospirillum agricola]|uniref:ribbon-helix-helix domain-containing protein n=1 Tax=Azospirillum agricola TaxID=1720247 RepID=UPI000A1CA6CF|nr:ribbon-helix-helix domain-containing protein [Azospirillum agricola]
MASEGKQTPRNNQSRGVSSLVGRALELSGRTVQIRLEPSYWEGLDEICRREDLTVDEVCADVKERMEQQIRRSRSGSRGSGQPGVSLANALRVFVVGYYRQAATERGHARAGHGRGDPFVSTPFDSVPATTDS